MYVKENTRKILHHRSIHLTAKESNLQHQNATITQRTNDSYEVKNAVQLVSARPNMEMRVFVELLFLPEKQKERK